MSAPTPAERGLGAAELAQALAELRPLLAGARLVDAQLLREGDDLLLVFEPVGGGRREFVQIAQGPRRARVCTTARRFPRAAFVTGPSADALRTALLGCALLAIEQPPGERRCTFTFAGGQGSSSLHVELFSARGLWALTDAGGRICALSRPVATAVRTLARGDRYAPPPARAAAAAEPAARFSSPVLPAIDAHFTALDLAEEQTTDREQLRAAAGRALQRSQQKTSGLQTQLAESDRAPALRAEADLMLAYAHTVRRGAAAMTVPDPERAGEERTFELDPALPVTAQAQARYERARRLEQGRAIAAARLQEAQALERELQQALPLLDAPDPAPADLDAVRALLQRLGALPRPARTKAAATAAPKPDRKWLGLNLRRFVSVEGYEVLVGRDNEQNDKLSLRIARGNDVWLHVGGGRAGSHVVVRLPKGKTASLETLLDAGTLAVHFSKARGEPLIDVVYTTAKHVRKPKGLPPGAVVPAQTKTIRVRLDQERLRRLLAGADAQD